MEKARYLNNFHTVRWNWVKGHDGNSGNEKADMLANKAIELKKFLLIDRTLIN